MWKGAVVRAEEVLGRWVSWVVVVDVDVDGSWGLGFWGWECC